MPTPKPIHSDPVFRRRGAAARARAYADPSTTCRRCGRTLAQHPYTKTGKPPSWEYGHDDDHPGDVRYCGVEVKGCNAKAGAVKGNLAAEPASREW